MTLLARRLYATQIAIRAIIISILCVSPAESAERIFRVGLLLNSHLAEGVDAFVAELRRLGYTDGQNLVLDWRLIDSARRNASLAAELVATKPDILIAAGAAGRSPETRGRHYTDRIREYRRSNRSSVGAQFGAPRRHGYRDFGFHSGNRRQAA